MIAQAGIFLLDAVVGFLTITLLLRFYMQVFRVSFNNPIGAFIVQLSNWLVKPLRRVLPGWYGLDLASLLAAYLLQMLLLLAVFSLRVGSGEIPLENLLGLLLWQGVLAILRQSLYLLIGALIVQAVLSWVNPTSSLAQPVDQFTRPFLRPLQRLLPPVAGIDLSPLIALLLAQMLLMFL
jgi:YggT family protein